jgi:hypothetical protein
VADFAEMFYETWNDCFFIYTIMREAGQTWVVDSPLAAGLNNWGWKMSHGDPEIGKW